MEVNLHKTETVRELGKVDVSKVQELVKNIPQEVWKFEHERSPNYNKNLVLEETEHIMLKYSDRRNDPIKYFEMPLWEEWSSIVLPVIEAAAKPFGYRKNFFPRVLIAKLPPNGKILPHIDGGKTGRGSRPHKVHIPLFTNEKCFFFIVPNRYHFQEGHAYEVNNGARHAAGNSGETVRIHLIFELLNWDAQSISNEQFVTFNDSLISH